MVRPMSRTNAFTQALDFEIARATEELESSRRALAVQEQVLGRLIALRQLSIETEPVEASTPGRKRSPEVDRQADMVASVLASGRRVSPSDISTALLESGVTIPPSKVQDILRRRPDRFTRTLEGWTLLDCVDEAQEPQANPALPPQNQSVFQLFLSALQEVAKQHAAGVAARSPSPSPAHEQPRSATRPVELESHVLVPVLDRSRNTSGSDASWFEAKPRKKLAVPPRQTHPNPEVAR